MKRKRTPSKLKKLAEKRSRTLADIKRYDRLKDEIQTELDKLEAKAQLLREKHFKLDHHILLNHNEIRAIDKQIKADFPSVSPEDIPPTFGFRREYGKRGGLKKAIVDLIANSGKEGISARYLANAICQQFDMQFALSEERRAWMKNSLYPAIKALADQNLIRHNGLAGNKSRWMAAQRLCSFDELLDLPHQSDA